MTILASSLSRKGRSFDFRYMPDTPSRIPSVKHSEDTMCRYPHVSPLSFVRHIRSIHLDSPDAVARTAHLSFFFGRS